MRPVFLLLPLSGLLSACALAPVADSAAAPGAADARQLGARHWQLAEAVDARGARIEALMPGPDRRLQLDISADTLSVSGGCNRMHAGYALEGSRLNVGPMAQTEMHCEGGGMAADEAIASRLTAGALSITLEGERLGLVTASGDRLSFDGIPTADARYGGEGERVFLEVAAQRVPCQHPLMPDYRCLHVRDVHYDDAGLKTGTGDWRFLYQDIEGYTHRPGTREVLRLKRYRIAQPPADGASLVHVLDMVVESETVAP